MSQKAIERFTKTVEDYIKYRPSYPQELFLALEKNCKLTKDKIIDHWGSPTKQADNVRIL